MSAPAPEVIRLPQRRPAMKPRPCPVCVPLPRTVRANDNSRSAAAYRLAQQWRKVERRKALRARWLHRAKRVGKVLAHAFWLIVLPILLSIVGQM